MTNLVLDIETAPVSSLSPEMSEEDIKKSSLNALDGRVIAIGALVCNNYAGKEFLSWAHEDEAILLRNFWDDIGITRPNKLIVHNGLNFDLPFLWRRSIIAKIRPALQADLRRYRTDPVYDTMAVWANWDPRSYPSLDALSQALGIGAKNGNGASVAHLWEERKVKTLVEYCLRDVWLTYACWCRMNFQEPTAFETLGCRSNIDIGLIPRAFSSDQHNDPGTPKNEVTPLELAQVS